MQFNQIKSLWLIKPAYLGTKHKTRLHIRINFYSNSSISQLFVKTFNTFMKYGILKIFAFFL